VTTTSRSVNDLTHLTTGAPFKMYTNTRSGALSGWQCPNAAFVGQYGASFYCPGLGNGIDVVAHEWGHVSVRSRPNDTG